VQEIIERDAVVGAWWSRYSLSECRQAEVLGSLPPSLGPRLLRPNLRYRFFRVGSPFSTHVTVTLIEGSERTGSCLAVGSACRETRTASWMKSILEAVHGYRYVRHLKEQRDLPPRGDHPATFEEHAVHYSLDPSRLNATVLRPGSAEVPLGGGSDRRPLQDTPEDIAVLAGRLGSKRPILFRSMTPPAIASEFGDWHVLKVLVPGLQPLHGSHLLAHLGGPLWAPRGLREYSDVPPHPFP
jgi:ribosomal protein S12 methylthiotransferase accessory factor YcaO